MANGLRVLADELALAVADELVDLTVGEAPHGLLVLRSALRRDQAHEQRPVAVCSGGSNVSI